MKIELGRFTVESDKNQFILYETRKKGTFPGKPEPEADETVREVIGFYATLESCFKNIPNKAIMRSEITDVKECIREIRHYKQMIKDAMG